MGRQGEALVYENRADRTAVPLSAGFGLHRELGAELYEDVVFYEILAEELALRDMDGEPLTRENYGALMERIDAYLDEFDEHGTDHISVDLVE